MDKVYLDSVEIKNVKRIGYFKKDLHIGLTVIGGNNRQGKTTILDSIAAAAGGEKFVPSDAVKDGEKKGQVILKFSNGVEAKRTFTENGSYLFVPAADGVGGQTLMRRFISGFSLDLGDFLNATDKEKAKMLLQVIGIDLVPLDEKRASLFSKRTGIGQMAERQQKHAEAMPFDSTAPVAPVSTADIVAEMQVVMARNADKANQRKRVADLSSVAEIAALRVYRLQSAAASTLDKMRQSVEKLGDKMDAANARVAEIEDRLRDAKADAAAAKTEFDSAFAQCQCAAAQNIDETPEIATAISELNAAKLAYQEASSVAIYDESTESFQQQIRNVEAINAKVRQNQERMKAMDQAATYNEEYRAITADIENVDAERVALLKTANMPLDGLSVADGALTFRGRKWDCMSGAEQVQVATAISHAIKPEMGFVLVDGLEALDLDTLMEFADWLEKRQLQAITTRVGKGGECDVIIEDGAELVQK